MNSKMDETIHQVIQNTNAHAQNRQIPVIVTYQPGSDLEEFKKYGLNIRHIFESTPTLSGEISVTLLKDFLNLSSIVKVEYDDPRGVHIQ